MKWILLFVVATHSSYLGGQTLEQTFDFAESQYQLGWFDRAEKAYKRVLFFDQENQYRGRCMEILAELAQKKGDFTDALNYLDQAYFLSQDEEEQNRFQLQRIQIFIATDQMQKALAEVYQTDLSFDSIRLRIYEAYCQYWLKDFDEVTVLLTGMLDQKTVERFINRAEKIEKMNPNFYQTMSYIFPGLGQILLGDVKQSVNSMLLNGGLAVLFIHTARRLSFFDAVISVIPWFYRYYNGGAKLTKQLAQEKKKKRHQKHLKELLQKIEATTTP